jgi:MFS family permease
VRGMGATESGLNLLPLVFALIVGATLTGQIVSRTGRYRLVILGAMVILAVGLFLMTSLRANTDVSTVWIWMIVAGLGVGPSCAVFTALVQNSVAPRVVGVATASLTFFQQIGGTIGLTIAGTVLADSLGRELPNRMLANNIPQQFVDGFQSQGGGGNALSFTGTGDLGERILSSLPPEAVPFVQPFIAQIVTSLQEAFALAIASTFWIGIAAAVIAAVFVLFVKDPDRAAGRPEGAPPLAM